MHDHAEEIEALREEKRKIDSAIDQNDIKYKVDTRDDLLIGYITLWIGTAFFIVLTIVFAKDLIKAYASNSDNVDIILAFVIFFGAISLILVVFNNLSYYFDLRRKKKWEKANANLYYETRKLDDKIRELENESSKHASDTGRFVHDFVRKDKTIMRDML